MDKGRGRRGNRQTGAGLAADEKARRDVVRPGRSFLVRAPAGSGKTGLLAKRYVKLVADAGVEPEHILCLTFTRKAAGEMRERIGKGLEKLTELTRDRVRVYTIDGFQRAVALGDSLRAKVMPRFRTMEREAVRDRALGEAGEAMEAICEEFDEYFSRIEIHRKASRMLGKRDQWRGAADELLNGVTREERDAGAAVLAELRCIADGAMGEIQAMEAEYDYIAVSEAATRLVRKLGTPADLAPVLGHPVRHILVDEFQDVSAAQLEFFRALTKGWAESERTFFAVGDSMQSIYRFRGAGTEVIRGMFAGGSVATLGKGGLELEVRELTHNFRSAAAVVEGVYGLLRRGQKADRERGEARLVRATAVRGSGHFELRVFGAGGLGVGTGEPGSEGGNAEARWVAERMRAWVSREGGGRGRRGGKPAVLAVLVRARSHFSKYIEPALGRVDDVDVDFGPLRLQACVNDMWALGRCIEDVDDEVAALALLRSPLLGLESREIVWLYGWARRGRRAGGGDRREMTPLARVLEGVEKRRGAGWEEGLGNSSVRAVQEFVATLWRARAEMRMMSVRGWLERAWLRAGGGVIYRGTEDRANVRQFLELVEEVSGRGRRCDWGELERVMRFARGASKWPSGSVKVMTIHGAKGLEFDEVIVPFLHEKGLERKRDLVVVESDGSRARTDMGWKEDDGCNREYGKLRRKEVEEDREELRRLLYVAATRAREACYLTLTSAFTRKGESTIECEPFDAGSMIAQVEGVAKKGRRKKKRGRRERNRRDVRDRPTAVIVGRFQADGPGGDGQAGCTLRLGEWDGRVEVVCGVAMVTGRPDPGRRAEARARVVDFGKVKRGLDRVKALCADREAAGTTGDRESAAIGAVVHGEMERVLRAWPEEGMGRYDSEWRRECKEDLREAGATDVERGARDVRLQIEGILADYRMKKLWEIGGKEGGCTLEFEKELREVGEAGVRAWRADLLVWNENRTKCLVVDVKTGREERDRHEAQVRKYEELVRGTGADDAECRADKIATGGALYYTRKYTEKDPGKTRLEFLKGGGGVAAELLGEEESVE